MPADQVRPSLHLVDPADQTCTRDSTIRLNGTASDNDQVARVTHRVGAGPETQLSVAPSAAVTFAGDIDLPAGLDTIVVTAYDRAGNSAAVQVSVRHLRLIAAHSTATSPEKLVFFDTGGYCGQDVTPVITTSARWAAPDWDPLQVTLVFQTSVDPRLYLVGRQGQVTRLLPSGLFSAESSPRFSRDGQWIYLAAGRLDYATNGVPSSLWRVHPDGTGLQRIGPAVTSPTSYDYPSPSPDDSRVVFVQNGYPYVPYIHVLDVATGAVQALGIIGETPRWSPSGDLVAFIDPTSRWDGLGVVTVMRPDGTQRRALTPPAVGYTRGLDWSPDGASVLVRSFNSARLEIIDVATGAVTPVPNTQSMFDAAW